MRKLLLIALATFIWKKFQARGKASTSMTSPTATPPNVF